MDFKLHTILVLTFLIRHCGAEGFFEVADNDIKSLYDNYREAVADNELKSYRRVFINNVEYQMHVNKLKDVNGLKLHNLILKTETQPHVNKTIYINNPLESKLPHPFLSFDEFKQTLTDRIQKQKDEVRKDNLKAELENARINKTKPAIKTRPLRTIYFIKATDTPHVAESKKVSNKLNVISTKWVRIQKTVKNTEKDKENITIKANFTKKAVTEEQHKITLTGGTTNTAKTTKPTVATTKNKLIPQPIQHSTTRKPLLIQSIATTNHTITTTKSDNLTTKSIKEADPELNKGIVTAKNSKETNTETIVPSGNETTEFKTKASELEMPTSVSESEPTEAQTEEPKTTTISTRATLGRPAVYMGR